MSCDFVFFFFNDTATTEIYTLSLHDALPILKLEEGGFTISDKKAMNLIKKLNEKRCLYALKLLFEDLQNEFSNQDRKSTRLNSSHSQISYAVFCLKKKNRVQGRADSRLMFPS